MAIMKEHAPQGLLDRHGLRGDHTDKLAARCHIRTLQKPWGPLVVSAAPRDGTEGVGARTPHSGRYGTDKSPREGGGFEGGALPCNKRTIWTLSDHSRPGLYVALWHLA